jgi:type II secretory pathway component PulJ
MRTKLKKRTAALGRTLIELVAALAIAAITGVALARIGVLGVRLGQSSLYEDQRVYPVRNAFDRVAQDLRLALAILPDCGAQGRQAIATLEPGGRVGVVLSYERDGQNRLLRNRWTDAGCSTLQSSSVIAYQVTDLSITPPVASDRSLELRLTATALDGTTFTLQERITGRGF